MGICGCKQQPNESDQLTIVHKGKDGTGTGGSLKSIDAKNIDLAIRTQGTLHF